ncbi:sigma-54 interaction domain-containing protein [Caldalkalibacillus horti]
MNLYSNLPDPSLYLQALLPISNDAIAMIDRYGEVVYWNDVAEQFYDIPKERIVGRPIREFFREEDLMVLQILKTEHSVRELYHRPKPDTHVLINASPVYDQQGSLIGAISVEQNISRLVKLNEELTQTSSQLDELKNELNRGQYEDPFTKIKGRSPELKQALELAAKVAQTDVPVLISGESGVGKELFARAIHQAGARSEQPIIPINCGAIPPSLFESELFGYESGAFTGATKGGKLGKIEMADGGTLFLDEIGELPLDMQVKLLRVLQEQEVYRVGATEARKVNVRIIAATNRDLEHRVTEGLFREDLFYRLNVISLVIPSLSQRADDLEELIHIFLQEFAARYKKPVPSIDFSVLQAFKAYSWPGNIRQLRNVLERIVVLTERGLITLADLPASFTELYGTGYEQGTRQASSIPPLSTKLEPSVNVLDDSDAAVPYVRKEEILLQEQKNALEKERIKTVLKETYGNKSIAAKKLGISRATLYQKIAKYQIVWEE